MHITGLEPALDWIRACLASFNAGTRVIGITGPVGSGKSTLADMCETAFGARVLSTDDYLPDYDAVAIEDRDDPESSDLALLRANLADLSAGKPAEVPIWSFQSHSREGYRTVMPAHLLIVEGLHALASPILEACDLAVFVEAPAEERLARWDEIERRGERGMGVDAARVFFKDVAEPTFARYREGYRAAADLLVTNPGRP